MRISTVVTTCTGLFVPVFFVLFSSFFYVGSNAFEISIPRSNPRRKHATYSRRRMSMTTPISTSSSRRVADAAVAASRQNSNMFSEDNYNGPIVLIGRSSSSSNELSRLASSLESSLGSTVERVTETTPPSSKKWPHVLVVDLADYNTMNNNNQESKFKEVVASLYGSNRLCIYVNVVVDDSSNDEPINDVDHRSWDEFLEKHSDYELVIKATYVKNDTNDSEDDQQQYWSHLEWELLRLLGRARLPAAIPGSSTPTSNTAHLTMGLHTFFLSLSFPEISQVQPYVEAMCQDVDAMEYRVDLLKCRDSRTDLIHGMQELRRYCRPHVVRVPALPLSSASGGGGGVGATTADSSSATATKSNNSGGVVLDDVMPIVYTVRTQHQAGTYPDDEHGISNMFLLLQWGLRAGIEVLDVESAWNPDATDELLDLAQQRYSSQILGSHHVVGEETTTEDAVLLFEQCALNGRAHGAKVVLSINSEDKDRVAYEASLIASELARDEGRPVIPHISLILGEIGQFSRVINLPFTPVTHESLPAKAAPGQMTANEILATRLLTKILQPKTYSILGHNIAYSVSPQMHGAAFAATKLPHQYVRVDVENVQEFIDSPLFQSSDFGGTSVTIPHKQSILPYIDVLSEAAKEIGSVNTVIAKQEFIDEDFKRVIYGDNTDWKGIYNPLHRLLGSTMDSSNNKGVALILGAGGTARAAAFVAAKKLGLQCIYYNRTPSKAQDLVDTFGGTVVTSLEPTGENSLGDALIRPINGGDTVAGTDAANAPSEGEQESLEIRVVISTLPAGAKFVLPEWIYERFESSKPVIFDVNYKPYYTDLLRQAESKGCCMVRGSEMLWEQGVGQFELWTGRTAPYRVMKEVVLANCVETTSQV